jgi:hypothetical protein
MIRIYNQGGSLFIGKHEENGVILNPRQLGMDKEGKLRMGKIIGNPSEMFFVGEYSWWEVKDEGMEKSYYESVSGLKLV